MEKATKELHITIPTTPRELREAAAFLETQMETRNVADKYPTYYFFGKELRIGLQADQSAYHQHKAGNKSSWA